MTSLTSQLPLFTFSYSQSRFKKGQVLQNYSMSSPSDTVTKSSLQFIKVTERFNTEKPYEIWASEYSSFPRTNCTFHTVGDVPIEDVRNLKTKPSLHLNGFEYISDPIQLPSSNIDETAKICINAALSLVEQKLNAQSVVCYDWRVCYTHCDLLQC